MEANKFITNELENMLTQMNIKRIMTDDELKQIFGEGKDYTHVDFECLIDSKANSHDVYTREFLQKVMEAYYGASPEIAREWYAHEMDRRSDEVIRKENEVVRCSNEVVRQESVSTMKTDINDKIIDVEGRMVSIETEFDALVDGTGFASLSHVNEGLDKKADKSDTYNKAEIDVKIENVIGGNTGTNVSFGTTVTANQWVLESEDIFKLDIFHELGTKRFIATVVDNDTNISVNANYKIVDENNVSFYHSSAINATITIVNGNTVTEIAYAKIDDENITVSRTWSSSKIKTEIDNKTVDLSPIELQIEENKKLIDANAQSILDIQTEIGVNKSKMIDATNKILQSINGVK